MCEVKNHCDRLSLVELRAYACELLVWKASMGEDITERSISLLRAWGFGGETSFRKVATAIVKADSKR
jgi:hypothetical protein